MSRCIAVYRHLCYPLRVSYFISFLFSFFSCPDYPGLVFSLPCSMRFYCGDFFQRERVSFRCPSSFFRGRILLLSYPRFDMRHLFCTACFFFLMSLFWRREFAFSLSLLHSSGSGFAFAP
ncbi:hypothetical protein C8J57DRAFT_280077 [Mycena rebaudengoi]|nr:hypothetical protein C8J57DRAFT_280077 [Mycena rebaudengoi]